MNELGIGLQEQLATVRKVTWRIVPLCFFLYIISYIDRANVGYAALQMNAELSLTSEAFGFAAGIFFIGYFMFEVPSNMMLARFGARIWVSRILFTWGICAMASAFVQNASQLYVARFMLGVAEAGFFPAIVVYFTAWFRAKEQATVLALFTAAIPVSYILGAPLSTFIMDHANGFGLSGWRWMFLIEGAPAIVGGIVTYAILHDSPATAPWLSENQRSWLVDEIAKDHAGSSSAARLSTWKAISNPRVLFLSLIYFVYQAGSLGVGYWLPQILKQSSAGISNMHVGLLAALPYILATFGMILWSLHSDSTGERRMHSAWPLLVAGIALGIVPLVTGVVSSLGLVAVALTGFYAFKAPFWTLPGLFLSRQSAAISIAAINSIGNLGGFAGPYIIGLIAQDAGSPVAGLVFLSGLTVIAFVMVCLAPLASRGGVIGSDRKAPAPVRVDAL